MTNFTADDALRSRFNATLTARARRGLLLVAGAFVLLAVPLGLAAGQLNGGAAAATGALAVVAVLCAAGCLTGALVIQFSTSAGRLLLRLALPVFLGGMVGMVLIAWAPALLYQRIDAIVADHQHLFDAGKATDWPTVSVQSIAQYLRDPPLQAVRDNPGPEGHWTAALLARVLWPLQFQLTRDVLSALGVLGFISLVAMFAIWWERKVAGRIQSRLGPMRVGGWHGWAQSLADGLKLVQKEDIFIGGADRVLFKLAPYVTFAPAVALFLALPFSAVWICRDLDVGLIFVFAMLGIGVLGVLLGGWASNNKWSMYGAMREACQMISYEIPLGFSLLVPVMTVGTLRLTAIGAHQAGGFHTWLAFENPFTFAAAVVFFIATLAECKRAPFDLPEAESELVAGYHTEYSGFRWALFFFAEYAEMFAVGALGALLFFGAWYSPLPAAWGKSWEHGPLWQQALHGIVFSGPLWFIAKGFAIVYVQMWLRWTLPRIRLDQVMFACVQVLLPIAMVVLLGSLAWGLFVPPTSWIAIVVNLLLTAIGVLGLGTFVWLMWYGFRKRRELVGSLAIEHLPGA